MTSLTRTNKISDQCGPIGWSVKPCPKVGISNFSWGYSKILNMTVSELTHAIAVYDLSWISLRDSLYDIDLFYCLVIDFINKFFSYDLISRMIFMSETDETV